MSPYRIESLGEHDRSHFDCGTPELNTYLKRQAKQDVRRRIAACYVLVETVSGDISGYYTLSAGSVLLAELPAATAKKLPRYPSVPVVRIGRLAVDQRYQGQSLGGVLLVDAIQRTAESEIGAFALVVDAKDDRAVAFYQHFGFTVFESAPRMLFLPSSEGLRKQVNRKR